MLGFVMAWFLEWFERLSIYDREATIKCRMG